ncbi:hypothetical protein WICANDRAFT_85857 [Wickerhamomyces anomalus NRRL Y-366-8]|uniref:ATP synthase assembly factor FMC1, mitochondrial n=1 Tax=Wickerhamomyces anomalus (strain ATCC 58044 / CBS 1984 / NCYC 433 / NRRL Y-366-8) TaxID=683960 RepID=A0A1E3NYJ4_WICAA|nr:uncharacterized protein WICANDRAFT_85857 [Wickerhamomyces anomalus NRRL Y-366-8]ODQ57772.1 hypothetical protein WICANDRAFT_85857 [Wickerhamomyces anomalus NRRL Y-366-8]
MTAAATAYKSLYDQLLINTKAAVKKQNAQTLKKTLALLNYQRLNAIKSKEADKLIQINKDIKKANKETEDPQVEVDSILLEGLKVTKETPKNIKHIQDIANFLSYQRTYQELIERYNPGLTMTQEDKVRRTANRVGLDLPEDLK